MLVTQILTRLQAWLRQHPHLKAWLLPAYVRMLHWRWQMRNLLTRHRPIVFHAGQFPLKMYPDGSIPEVLYSGSFEATERDFVAAFLQPGMTVVDAGANVGLYTLAVCALVGATGKVYAFEPGRLTFERLRRNLDLNQCKNVVATHVALSNTHEQMVLRMDPTHPTLDAHRFVQPIGTVIRPTSTDEIVECQTLDGYFLAHEVVGTIDFMKIDVEGAELALLQGAERTLARSTDITILLECTQNRDQVRDLLVRHGFQCFVWDGVERALRPVVFDEAIATGSIVLRRQQWDSKL